MYSCSDGEVQEKSGLNWGHADAHVTTGDAYIPLPSSFFRDHPDFFPPQGNTITTIWDDKREIICLLEGTQDIGGITYPKQISSADDKSVIGEYLRKRLGVSRDCLITKSDLSNYGRLDIEVSRRSTGEYYFDFSLPARLL